MTVAPIVLPGLGPGRSALITGGTGAIGRATAEALIRMGVSVAINGRSPEATEAAANDLGSGVLALPGDIANPIDADRIVQESADRWGSLDVLVHSAALSEGAVPLDELTDHEIDEVVRVNVRGSLMIARAAGRLMCRQGGGRIVNVASVAAHRALPGRVVYGTTKAALVQLTRQLAVELGPCGVMVNSVSPGQTPTFIRLVDEPPGSVPRPKVDDPTGEATCERIPLRRRGQLADFVGPILFLASNLAAYVTGVDIPIDGGAMVLR